MPGIPHVATEVKITVALSKTQSESRANRTMCTTDTSSRRVPSACQTSGEHSGSRAVWTSISDRKPIPRAVRAMNHDPDIYVSFAVAASVAIH